MTKTEWDGLAGKQRWDVLVALRGPDCQNSESLKWITTGVLRWALKDVIRVGGTLNESLSAIILPSDPGELDVIVRDQTTGTKRGTPLCWSPSHFCQHMMEAASICGVPSYYIDNAPYWEAIGQTHTARTILLLWKWATDNNKKRLVGVLTEHLKQFSSRPPEELFSIYGLRPSPSPTE